VITRIGVAYSTQPIAFQWACTLLNVFYDVQLSFKQLATVS